MVPHSPLSLSSEPTYLRPERTKPPSGVSFSPAVAASRSRMSLSFYQVSTSTASFTCFAFLASLAACWATFLAAFLSAFFDL
jgi:hypothetical protein